MKCVKCELGEMDRVNKGGDDLGMSCLFNE